MELGSAVRVLRLRLGDSQQAFATRLGLSIRAIANYEKGRTPTGRSLAALARVAEENGHEDLAVKFRNALAFELGFLKGSPPRCKAADDLAIPRALEPETEEEVLAVAEVLALLRDRRHEATVESGLSNEPRDAAEKETLKLIDTAIDAASERTRRYFALIERLERLPPAEKAKLRAKYLEEVPDSEDQNPRPILEVSPLPDKGKKLEKRR